MKKDFVLSGSKAIVHCSITCSCGIRELHLTSAGTTFSDVWTQHLAPIPGVLFHPKRLRKSIMRQTFLLRFGPDVTTATHLYLFLNSVAKKALLRTRGSHDKNLCWPVVLHAKSLCKLMPLWLSSIIPLFWFSPTIITQAPLLNLFALHGLSQSILGVAEGEEPIPKRRWTNAVE